jgi:circadian clock protein KaiB
MKNRNGRVKKRTASPRISPKSRAKKKSPGLKRTDAPAKEPWIMRLYVAGQSTRSLAAIANLRSICDKHIPPGCMIEVIDLLRNPELARNDQIIAVPTLIRKLPQPIRRIIGDLSATERVLLSLELLPA